MTETAASMLDWLRDVAPAARDLRIDSRQVRPGDVFVALPGAHGDGRRYIDAAVAGGAIAVLAEGEEPAGRQAAGVPLRWSVGVAALLGPLADLYYGRPSSRLLTIGVTGTNGKTSSTFWIAQILAAAGRPCAVVGTLGAGMPPAPLDRTGLTTPDAATLQRCLRQLIDGGAVAVAMEVSSIGLDQGRVDGVAFDVALFTNLTRDHLDYHPTMAAYRDAKARLFEVPGLTHAVVNLDDDAGRGIALDALRAGLQVIGFGIASAAQLLAALGLPPGTVPQRLTLLTARDVRATTTGLEFEVGSTGPDPTAVAIAAPLVGMFNVANLLGVLGVALAAGMPLRAAADACATLRAPPGRMERIDGGADPAGAPVAIVDYAHTPDAIEKALVALQPLARARGGRLWIVFGAGGDRDPGKRRPMGEIAARLADRVLVTSDNPRSEDPAAIVAEVAAGAGQGAARTECVVDRASAIARAVRQAAPQDVVLIAGKGHETEQEIGGRRLPFFDPAQVRAALVARAAAHAEPHR
jgi:UDP-N-acetylmuramoyl-L-alanyl-D-glutamate--2,6-diaminopimelate ligase